MNLLGNVGERNYTQSGISVIDYAYTTSRTIPVYDESGQYYYYRPTTDDYNFNILNELDNSFPNRQMRDSVVI